MCMVFCKLGESINQLIQMQKEQSKGIVLKTEIKKERMVHYPFHLIMDTYAHDQDYYFIVCVDYATDSTVLAIYPFAKDMTKLAVCGITINNILSKKAVSALHVLSLRYKPTSMGVVIIQAEFVIGYRSGQVAVIEYKDKECKLVTKLNKTLKSEGIFSKTSSFFFGDEDTYSVHIREAVRSFTANHSYPDLSFSYLIGNQIIFMKNLNQNSESSFFQTLESNSAEEYQFHYDLSQSAEKGYLTMFGNTYYYALKDNKNKVSNIKFNSEVTSYKFLPAKRKQLAVSLGMKQMILLINTTKFVLHSKISTEMSIRRLNFFMHREEQYLSIMFYDNYVVLYELNSEKYCKITGHRSFIANTTYSQQNQMLISGGMDHRIALIKMNQIKENNWQKAVSAGRDSQIEDTSCGTIRFTDIFSLGEYNNVRTNLHSYGFADLMMMNEHYCLPTYDAKIMVYKYK